MKIITISREFGSGGRELGKRMADLLGIAYYDREIIAAISKESKLDETYVAEILAKGILRSYPITIGRTFAYPTLSNQTANNILIAQQKVVKSLAEHGDCIIMGQSADILLKEQQPLSLFVYADMTSKISRCRERSMSDENLTDSGLRKQIKQIDAARASRYDMISSSKWGAKENYHLCINTTNIEIKAIAPQIAEYAKIWLDMRK
ncbi:MAG: AAA family ATPase [Suipraeoptans sp.]